MRNLLRFAVGLLIGAVLIAGSSLAGTAIGRASALRARVASLEQQAAELRAELRALDDRETRRHDDHERRIAAFEGAYPE